MLNILLYIMVIYVWTVILILGNIIEKQGERKMIKKIIVTMALWAIIVIQTSSGGLMFINSNTDFVDTKVGPVPVVHLFGDMFYGDNFYKDFTK